MELKTNTNFTIISQQLNLEKLELSLGYTSTHFDALPEIKELQVTDLRIHEGFNCIEETSLLNLEAFVRTQKSIESFRLSANLRNPNAEIYGRILAHVFNLETLSAVKTNYALPFQSFLDIRKHHVRKLSFTGHVFTAMELSSYLKFFPRITSLEIGSGYTLSEESVHLINDFKFLEELVIFNTRYCPTFMSDLQVESLKKFEIDSDESFDCELFENLKKRHPNMTEMRLNDTVFN